MDEKPFETINVIPFVDIMLVLLTMVLTTANFIATGRIPLALPQASQTKVEKHKDITIEVSATGALAIESAPVAKDELENRIKALPADTSFLVRADRATPASVAQSAGILTRTLDCTSSSAIKPFTPHFGLTSVVPPREVDPVAVCF